MKDSFFFIRHLFFKRININFQNKQIPIRKPHTNHRRGAKSNDVQSSAHSVVKSGHKRRTSISKTSRSQHISSNVRRLPPRRETIRIRSLSRLRVHGRASCGPWPSSRAIIDSFPSMTSSQVPGRMTGSLRPPAPTSGQIPVTLRPLSSITVSFADSCPIVSRSPIAMGFPARTTYRWFRNGSLNMRWPFTWSFVY